MNDTNVKTQINPHDLTLTISLAKEDQERMQLVYASQLYGTFFGIFSSFEIDYENPKSLMLKGVHLRLINYKGLINLGIAGVAKKVDRGQNDSGRMEVSIYFKVQALKKPEVLRYYEFQDPVLIEDKDLVTFNRKLVSLNVDSISGVNHTGIFDYEFYERDGLYNRKRDLRMDDEPEEGWGIEPHSGRRYKPKSMPNKEKSLTLDEMEYNEGVPLGNQNTKGEKRPESPGGRCPKAMTVAKY